MVADNNFKDRFKAVADYKGLSIKEFERVTGLANGLIGKMKNPNIDSFLKVINTFPDINPMWLITGEGSITGPFDIPMTREPAGIPFLDGEQVVAGPPAGDGANLAPSGYVNFPGLTKEMGDFAVRAKGRSMVDKKHPERSIPEGSIVLLSTKLDLSLQWGETYCLATRNGYVIKRIMPGSDEQHIKCVSNNEEEGYVPYEIHTQDFILLARVTAVITIKNL